MRIERADTRSDKGWYLGSWNSDLKIAIGYASTGINEPHVHAQISEIYLIARGTSEMRVEQETIILQAGDVLLLQPGEAHTFLSSSPDYFHFVLHAPSLAGDKSAVSKERLGL